MSGPFEIEIHAVTGDGMPSASYMTRSATDVKNYIKFMREEMKVNRPLKPVTTWLICMALDIFVDDYLPKGYKLEKIKVKSSIGNDDGSGKILGNN